VYGQLVYEALSGIGIRYPEDHERRVESTIEGAMMGSLPSVEQGTVRILEVGAGENLRVLRRGLYDKSFRRMLESGINRIEYVGVDIRAPTSKILEEARKNVNELVSAGEGTLRVDVSAISESITSRLDYADGYFDCVACFLTLCSVADQKAALTEIRRLLKPSGGTFGYVEHVAVEEDEPYQFLELQQKLLDPLQQRLADNCHLRRHTESAILEAFGPESKYEQLGHERFLVNLMWPVSCQCCGVIQRRA